MNHTLTFLIKSKHGEKNSPLHRSGEVLGKITMELDKEKCLAFWFAPWDKTGDTWEKVGDTWKVNYEEDYWAELKMHIAYVIRHDLCDGDVAVQIVDDMPKV